MLRLVDELFNADNIVPARTRIRYIRLLVQDNGPSYFQDCSNFITTFNCIFYFTSPLKHVTFAPVVVVVGSDSGYTNTKLNRGEAGVICTIDCARKGGDRLCRPDVEMDKDRLRKKLPASEEMGSD